MKKFLLAQPRGYCFGVKRALAIVDRALEKYTSKKIYVFNEIVHNKTVVADLKNKGVTFTQNPEDILENSILIFSAHGISPKIKKAFADKALTILDATCPLVEKVHKEARTYSQKGYHIIYICHKKHDEAVGVLGEMPNNFSVVENENDITNIAVNHEKYIILTQTTLNLFEVEALFEKIKKIIPYVEFPSRKDLCKATTERQLAVKNLAKRCDLFLIIGSPNSSNSKRLQEIACTYCPSYLIDSFKDIEEKWLSNIKTIGISSGASAPEFLVEDTLSFLKEKGFQK